MARENTNQTQQINAPDYLAWHVTQRAEKSFWTKVGRARSSNVRRREKGASRLRRSLLLLNWVFADISGLLPDTRVTP